MIRLFPVVTLLALCAGCGSDSTSPTTTLPPTSVGTYSQTDLVIGTGAVALHRLMNGSRAAVANLNGLLVMLTTFLASAQVFNLVTPESGLPRLLFDVFFLVLLLNTLAAAPDRVRVLRSLVVIFGSAFVLKFIVLAALSDPAGGMLKRVLLVLLEGVTLGTLTQDVFHESTGYLAFFTLALFMTGLALLPSSTHDRSSSSLVARQ